MLHLKLDSITIIPLSDGRFARPASGVFPNVSEADWQPFAEYLNPDGTVPLNFGAFLINESGAWTLVDTGMGNRPQSPGGKIAGLLAEAGVEPAQVMQVIITHLHGDHIGGTTVDRDGRPELVFKNARHLVQQKDWDYWGTPEMKKNVPAIALCAEPLKAAGQLDLVEGDHTLSAGISLLFTPGHTAGHQSVLVGVGAEKAIITGDVTHTPAQASNPGWTPSFDVDPEVSARTRASLWDRVEQEGLKVCAGHYPYPSMGEVVRVDGQRRWRGIAL